MVCGQSKLKALGANTVLQCTKAVEAADSTTRYCIYKSNWYIVGLLQNNAVRHNLSCYEQNQEILPV